jgi:hypothetical protein
MPATGRRGGQSSLLASSGEASLMDIGSGGSLYSPSAGINGGNSSYGGAYPGISQSNGVPTLPPQAAYPPSSGGAGRW